MRRPTSNTFDEVLSGISADDASDVWAVGRFGNAGELSLGRHLDATLTLHWNGAAWAVVPSPDPSWTVKELVGPVRASGGSLEAVDALSPTDVWAVGIGGGPFIEHWNGTRWAIVHMHPEPPGGLFGVSAVSPHDVWAVGGGGGTPLVERWNGARWHRVPIPFPGEAASLHGVAALSGDDVWVVGQFEPGTGPQERGLVEHWDGARWGIIPNPNPSPSGLTELRSVAATSARDAWVVGLSASSAVEPATFAPVVEHWGGARWEAVRIPAGPPGRDVQLSSVAVTSADQAWLAGTSSAQKPWDVPIGFVDRWNGSAWSPVDMPEALPSRNPPRYKGAVLDGVTALSGGPVWAVGRSWVGDTNHSLIERGCAG